MNPRTVSHLLDGVHSDWQYELKRLRKISSKTGVYEVVGANMGHAWDENRCFTPSHGTH
jgi:hypothetical protein